MKNSFENTNDKNIGQVSKHNPGWAGKGVPTLKSLIVKALRDVKANIFNGNLGLLRNTLISTGSNLKAFVFNKNQHIVHCPCCNWKGSAFITTYNSKRINHNSNCPVCDSRSRHRGLSTLLNQVFENKNVDLLFFAPERILLNILNENFPNIRINTTDYYSTDVDYPNEDIQNLSFPDQRFEYVLCNHVIEHVPEDDQAFAEISRILKKNGKAVITIPGDYHLERTVIFEQTDSNGHFRHYGLDVIKKMEKFFKKVDVIDLYAISNKMHGVRKKDMAFICFK